MAEDVKEEVEETPEGDQSEVEDLAKELGWNPEYEGENAKSAREFILNSRNIQDTMRQLMKRSEKKVESLEQQLTNGLDAVKSHFKKTYEAEKRRLEGQIEKLKAERREAIEEGDADRVDKIDAEIEAAKTSTEPPDFDEKISEPPPAFADWVDKNPWYENDPELRAYADAQGDSPEFRGMKYETMLKKVTERVKNTFPEKFDRQRGKPSAPAAETPATPAKKSSTKKHTYRDLTDQQKAIWRDMEPLKIMSLDDYIKDLETQGAI